MIELPMPVRTGGPDRLTAPGADHTGSTYKLRNQFS
jgi:hypothetical protein